MWPTVENVWCLVRIFVRGKKSMHSLKSQRWEVNRCSELLYRTWWNKNKRLLINDRIDAAHNRDSAQLKTVTSAVAVTMTCRSIDRCSRSRCLFRLLERGIEFSAILAVLTTRMTWCQKKKGKAISARNLNVLQSVSQRWNNHAFTWPVHHWSSRPSTSSCPALAPTFSYYPKTGIFSAALANEPCLWNTRMSWHQKVVVPNQFRSDLMLNTRREWMCNCILLTNTNLSSE